MIGWLMVMVAQERYKDLLREAEKERLVRRMLAEREKSEPLYCQALIWLGRRLVAWGQHLQERYGPVMEPCPKASKIQPMSRRVPTGVGKQTRLKGGWSATAE